MAFLSYQEGSCAALCLLRSPIMRRSTRRAATKASSYNEDDGSLTANETGQRKGLEMLPKTAETIEQVKLIFPALQNLNYPSPDTRDMNKYPF